MVSRRNLVLALGGTAIAGAAGYAAFQTFGNRPARERPRARVFLNWFFTSSFAGDVLAADKFASAQGIDIDLQVGGEGRDPLKLVRDGDIGVASADEILRAIDKGGDFQIIGVLNDTHPAAFAALASSGIRTPKDFEGKRVGLLPFGATGLIYQALLVKAGVDRNLVKEVVVSPDLRPFLAGTVNDVQPVFQYDEPVALEKLGIAYTLVDPRQYGVDFKGQCYFTTRRTIQTESTMIEAALAAFVQGWANAKQAPDDAIAALKKRSPSLVVDDELPRLTKALPFFVPTAPGKILASDAGSWQSMVAMLAETKAISAVIETNRFLDLSLLERAYDSRVPR